MVSSLETTFRTSEALGSEYQIKLATVNEYKEALQIKKLYDDLVQEFLGLLPEIVEVLNRNSTSLKDRQTLNRTLERAYAIVQKRATLTPEAKHPFKNTDGETKPKSCMIQWILLQISSLWSFVSSFFPALS